MKSDLEEVDDFLSYLEVHGLSEEERKVIRLQELQELVNQSRVTGSVDFNEMMGRVYSKMAEAVFAADPSLLEKLQNRLDKPQSAWEAGFWAQPSKQQFFKVE